jgi:hypothetical protein
MLGVVAKWRANGEYSTGNAGQLFVMNRYLFKVPTQLKRGEARFFGGWTGVPHDENGVNPLWPLAVAKDGRLKLVGRSSRYFGDEFQAVEEFDYLNLKYGRRP